MGSLDWIKGEIESMKSAGRFVPIKVLEGPQGAWLPDVQVVFFGPSEELIISDNPEIRAMLEKLMGQGVKPFACSAIAKGNGIEAGLMQIGMDVLPVGPLISSYIKKGYATLTF